MAGEVSAAGAEGLADRAHPEIAVGWIDPEEIADAPAAGSHRAERVGLVDVEQRVVTFLRRDEFRQVGVVAVHAIDALDRDHHAAVLRPQVAQQAIELLVVVVAEGTPARLRGVGALHDAVVGQLVIEDQVALAEQMVEH